MALRWSLEKLLLQGVTASGITAAQNKTKLKRNQDVCGQSPPGTGAVALEQLGVLGGRGELCWTLHEAISWHEIFGILTGNQTQVSPQALGARCEAGLWEMLRPWERFQRPGASILGVAVRGRGPGDPQAPSAPPSPRSGELVASPALLGCGPGQRRHIKGVRSEFGKESEEPQLSGFAEGGHRQPWQP